MTFTKTYFSLTLLLSSYTMVETLYYFDDTKLHLRDSTVRYVAKQLTYDEYGHSLNTSQCFSKNGDWLVYDTRNFDTDIAKTGSIEMVNVKTKEVRVLYKTTNQSEFGPGVGAVSFSPIRDRVIFIQGIRNAGAEKPYSFTRRTGVAIDVDAPQQPIFMDARNVMQPFAPGALRGGTHAHQWSGNGNFISFTYNDFVIEQAAKSNPKLKDLRTVGVMFSRKVLVKNPENVENNHGAMYSMIVATVKENPELGSNEINKAFDEGWIGKDGYVNANGKRKKRAIAFQGNVVDENGKEKTEIFVVDLPDVITVDKAGLLTGTENTRPLVPENIKQRRVSFLKHGVMGPRHWLRTTPDGKMIVFLSKDDFGIINAFGISPNGGDVKQLTFHKSNIQSGVNISPNGKSLAYLVNNSIYITDIFTKKSTQILERFTDFHKPVGCIQWSPDGKILAFNGYIESKGQKYLQIFTVDLRNDF
jgi:hypothetical protein